MSEQQTIVHSRAAVETKRAARYLTQLCKHFQHKRPVTLGERSGRIAFAVGDCRLDAQDTLLTLALEAPDEAQLAQLQDVVARHLRRFAFRDELQIDWQRA